MTIYYGLNSVELGGDAEGYDEPECSKCGGDQWVIAGEYLDDDGKPLPIYKCADCGAEAEA